MVHGDKVHRYLSTCGFMSYRPHSMYLDEMSISKIYQIYLIYFKWCTEPQIYFKFYLQTKIIKTSQKFCGINKEACKEFKGAK